MRIGCSTVLTSSSIEQWMSKPNLRNTTNHTNTGNTEKHPTKVAENADTNHQIQNWRVHRRKHQRPICRDKAAADHDTIYPQHPGYHQRFMWSEMLVGNAHVGPAITCHWSARDAAVRLSLIKSLQEMGKMAEPDSSKGSDLLVHRKQKSNVPLPVRSSAGEVGRESAWVGKCEVTGVDGNIGRDTTSLDRTKIKGSPWEPESTNVKSISMWYRNT